MRPMFLDLGFARKICASVVWKTLSPEAYREDTSSLPGNPEMWVRPEVPIGPMDESGADMEFRSRRDDGARDNFQPSESAIGPVEQS